MRKTGTWLVIGILLPALGLAAETVPTTPPAPECGSSCHWRAFEQAWTQGELEIADRELALALAEKPQMNAARVAQYRIFARKVCDLGALPRERLYQSPNLEPALYLCRAFAAGGEPSAAVRAQILDAQADWQSPNTLYDAYARQPELDLQALVWLRGQGLDDHRYDPYEREGALISQIRAGRVANVEALLGLGYDADEAVLNATWSRGTKSDSDDGLGILPLEAARQSLGIHPVESMQIARVLLAHGADPFALSWYPPPKAGVNPRDASPEQVREFENVLAAAKADRDPVGVRFQGFLQRGTYYSRLDVSTEQTFVRLLVGNGSAHSVEIPAWKDSSGWDLSTLHTSGVEYRAVGATRWRRDMLIEDGWSPHKRLVLQPRESKEVVFFWNRDALGEPAGYEYRIWLTDSKGKVHATRAFRLQEPTRPLLMEYTTIKALPSPKNALKRLEEDASPDPGAP